MSKHKMATHIKAFNCDHCSAVHIQLLRHGKPIAEAIPASIEMAECFASDLQAAITEMKVREGAARHVH